MATFLPVRTAAHRPTQRPHDGRMPRSPTLLPLDLGETFACAAAIGQGVSPKRLRAHDLEAPFHGTRLRARRPQPDSPFGDDAPLARDRARRREVLRRAHAYAQVMPPGSFFSGRTAAVIHGAPVEHGPELDVAVFAPARAPRGRGIRGIKVSPALAHTTQYDGLRVATPASAWAMLSAQLTVLELVVLGDALVQVPRDFTGARHPERALATPRQLARAVAAGRRPGVPRLRAALALVRVGSSSPLETEYRLDAAACGLPDPLLDVEIRDARRLLLGISEVAYPRYRTIVEIEGDHHRTSRTQWDRDIDKYRAYAAEGWEVVRLTSRHLRCSPPRGATTVREVLVRHGWDPRSTAG